jgi:glycosyltransferase involved in cell wall biosynthesis
MRAQKADVELLSPLKARAKYMLAPVKLMARARGKSVTLDHFRVVLEDYSRQIRRFVRDRSIDVVFSTSSIPITLLDCGKPIVIWSDAVFHSMNEYYAGTFANMTSTAVKRGLWQEETSLRNCTIAAFASTWALEGAQRFARSASLRVLPFGSSLPVRHAEEDIARRAAKKRVKRMRRCELLFVGSDWERKGGETAVETARLLNERGIETKLRIVGSQPEGELPRFVESFGFINKSSEKGMQKLIDLFRVSDFFILPSNAEAAGIVFSEASSYGLPSLAYATGGVTDYVRNGVNGFCFEPGTGAEAFASEILRIMEDPAEYESLSVQAFAEYRNRLNWETSVRRLIGFCMECVGTSAHRPAKAETKGVKSIWQ